MNDVKKILIAAISVVLVVAIVAGVSIGVLAGKVNNMEDQVAELAGLKQTVETLQSENAAMKTEIAEAAEKLVTAEDFEAKLAAAIGEQNQTMQAIVSTAVKNQIEELGVEGLTEAQVKEIINAAVANCITEDEVNEIIANSDTGLTEAEVKKIITNANAGYLTYAQIVNLIDDNIYDLRKYLEDVIGGVQEGLTTMLVLSVEDAVDGVYTIDNDAVANLASGINSVVTLSDDDWSEISIVIDEDLSKFFNFYLYADIDELVVNTYYASIRISANVNTLIVKTIDAYIDVQSNGSIGTLIAEDCGNDDADRNASVSNSGEIGEFVDNADGYTVTIGGSNPETWTETQDGIEAVFEDYGKTVSMKFLENVEADLIIPAGYTVSLDLNGKTMTGTILAKDATLTVTNGTVENDNKEESAIEINKGTLTLDNVEILSARHAVRIDGDVVATIDGGTYVVGGTSDMTQHAINISGNATLTINGGTFVGPNGTNSDSGSAVNVQSGATVLITGGNFSGGLNNTLASEGKLSVAGGTFDQDPTVYAAGATVTVNTDGTYTVSPAKASTNADLSGAIDAGATYVELGEGEFTLPSLSDKQGMTLIGAADGSTVIGGENVTTGFGSQFGKNTTIKNITFSGSTNGVRYSYAQGGTSVFENCTFAGGSTYGFHIDSSNGATFVFNNCTFVGFNAFAGDLESVTFNNCTFKSNGSYGHTNIWSTGHFNDCTFEEGVTYGVRGNGVIYINGVQQ